MGVELPDTLTTVTPTELYEALRDLTSQQGAALSRGALLTLVSQFAFETAGGKACHCFNIGNAKCPPGDTVHDYTFFRCNEIINGKVVWFDPPDPACRFRAFSTLDQGVGDYFTLMQKRFAKAWPAAVAGDVDLFCHELKVAGYYTADEDVYTRGVRAWYARLDDEIPPDPAPLARVASMMNSLSDVAANANQTAVDEQFNPRTDKG